MNYIIPSVAVLASLLGPPCAPGQEPPAQPSLAPKHGEAMRVEHDRERFVTRIAIRAAEGTVCWADVVRGLARARGYDDSALEGVLPEGQIDLSSHAWRVTRLALNLALRPHVRFEVQPAAPPETQPRLVIALDRTALLCSQQRFQKKLRGALTERRRSRREYGLAYDEGWQEAPPERSLVVLVHGLDSRPERCEALLAPLRKAGLPCAALRYPNDQPIVDSARLLSAELKKLAKEQPRRGVSLLTTSMGGLVARAVVEDSELDPGNVRRLIMLVPPNHGSALARFEFGLDLWEHLADESRRKQAGLFYALVEDGLSEAAVDLMPGSPFLQKLNARPRNPAVRYAIVLGTGGPLRDEDLARLKEFIAAAGPRSRWARFFGARMQSLLDDADEVVEGKGDGAVSLARGRLDGVSDTLVLRFSHLGAGPDWPKVQREILARLAAR